VSVEEDTAYSGEQSIVIEGNDAAEGDVGEWLVQHIDIRPYRQQNILISARMKTADVIDADQVQFQAQTINFQVPAANYFKSQVFPPTTNWQEISMVVPVHRQAESLLLAFGLKGAGQLWLDDVQIEPLGELVWSEIHAQSEQLETLQEAWTLINRKYLYEDFNGVDWQKMWTQTSAKVEDGLSEEAFWRLMEGMVAALDDDHSVFLTPDEVDTQFALFKGEGGYSGIGVYVQKVFDSGFHVVTFVFPGSPAAQAGIRPHDRLLQADGLPICCPGDKGPLGEVSGPAGTEVKLTVQTPGEAPRDLVD
jgi:hypothetical protein